MSIKYFVIYTVAGGRYFIAGADFAAALKTLPHLRAEGVNHFQELIPAQFPQLNLSQLSTLSEEQRNEALQQISVTFTGGLNADPNYDAKPVHATGKEQCTVRVSAMEPIPSGSNPFLHDDWPMGVMLACGWVVMLTTGLDRKDDPHALTWLYLVNTRSGQRIKLNFDYEGFQAERDMTEQLVDNGVRREVLEVAVKRAPSLSERLDAYMHTIDRSTLTVRVNGRAPHWFKRGVDYPVHAFDEDMDTVEVNDPPGSTPLGREGDSYSLSYISIASICGTAVDDIIKPQQTRQTLEMLHGRERADKINRMLDAGSESGRKVTVTDDAPFIFDKDKTYLVYSYADNDRDITVCEHDPSRNYVEDGWPTTYLLRYEYVASVDGVPVPFLKRTDAAELVDHKIKADFTVEVGDVSDEMPATEEPAPPAAVVTIKGVSYVGFWNNAKNQYPQFPMPVATNMSAALRNALCKALLDVEDHAKNDSYRGYSECRVCGSQGPVMGCREFFLSSISKTSGQWRWPNGLRHYIMQHGVAPPEEFVTKVLGFGVHSLQGFGFYDLKVQS